jgi:hypothetical protein
MTKVFHVTLALEVAADTPHPEDWDWHQVIEQIPNLNGFSIVNMAQRPFNTMEEDPFHHTQH